MGALADAIGVLKDVLQMRGDLDRLAKNVEKLSSVADDLDRRMVRIETMAEIASRRSTATATAKLTRK